MQRVSNIQYCLDGIGVAKPGLSTLVVTGTISTPATPEQVWKVWSDLSTWPHWSPLHKATNWVGGPGFVAGAQFEQTLDLGFPAGTNTQLVTLDVCDPMRHVSWSGDKDGLKSCHSWQFTPTADGGTEISNAEAFSGTTIALVKPLVARRWNKQFQEAVERLSRAAQG